LAAVDLDEPLAHRRCPQSGSSAFGLFYPNHPDVRQTPSATVASILTSLIATCVQAGVNALEYLVALPIHRSAVFRQPTAWLPWNYQANLVLA
jgi:hypothetical protein